MSLGSDVESLKGKLALGALKLIALLPWRGVQALGRAIGWLMWKIPNRSRDIVRINLAHCFPELSAADREQLTGRTLKKIQGYHLPKAPVLGFGRQKKNLRVRS